MDNLQTVLHYYYFNIEDKEQREAYENMCRRLKGLGLKKFASISPDQYNWYKNKIRPLDGQVIELETRYLFGNQWNTAPVPTSELGLRVFDWAEAIYPNRNIKEGMWLEQTEMMRHLRSIFMRCNWCGKNPLKSEVILETCPLCGKSGYLEALT